MKRTPACCLALAAFVLTSPALASPETYTLDPDHTHPSFEVDHFGGLSVWRGVFKSTSGTAVLDVPAQTGSVDVKIDTGSIDFGMDALNKHVSGAEMLDVAKYPVATYHGTLGGFKDGAPTTLSGELTLHGVTKPVNLTIDSFKCIQHPIKKKQVCGADAKGEFNRADFGVDYGAQLGFKMNVALRIQVEAVKN